jgi:membrane peptidoglycan carboxypeptidase
MLAIGGVLGTGGTVALVGYYSQGLPSLDQLRVGNLDQTTRIYDRNGVQITSFYVENRTVVPLSKIAQSLQDATISTEDRTFYSNQGVDYRRVVIAAVYDATHRGSVIGGSTITQQLIKNDVLCGTCGSGSTNGAGEQSFSRKMRELLLAEELERRDTKQQILELYLNSIPYGNRAFGIEAAARTYFGVPAASLTVPEASFLAGLPQAPSAYNPFGTPDQKAAAKSRWLEVLDSMVANNKLSSGAAEAAFKTDIWSLMAAHHAAAGTGVDPLTGHFVDYTVQYLKDHGYDEQTIMTGGLSIYTTLDLATQQKADASVKAAVAALKYKGANTGALLAMDPRNGEILAMVGSADYANDSIQGQVNLTDVGRQPGSSFKPYTYAYALQTGHYTPSTLLNDHDAVIGGAHFTDWDGRTEGYISLRTAVAQSRNLPALWTFRDVGPQNVIDFAHKLGALGNFDAGSLTTTIGSSDIKMVDHLAAYSAFDNGGFRVYPHPVLRVVDPSGRTLPAFPENTVGGSVISPDLAYLMTSILHGVPGTELGMNALPVAGKTGTTDGYTSSWMMGYTPNLAVGTFMGHINAGPTCDSGFLTKGSPGVPTSGWICPTNVLWGEDVGATLWKPFLMSYYSGSRSWPSGWTATSGVTSAQVCNADGGLAPAGTPASQTYLEVFLRSAPPRPCGQNVAPGVPTPAPSPSPTPTPVVTPLPSPSSVPVPGPAPSPGVSPSPHK